MQATVHFSNIKGEIIGNLKKATREIKVAVAWFTDEDLLRTLSQKAEQGIAVHLVISDSKENFYNASKFKEFLRCGGCIYVSSPKFLHNKFCIIDDSIVINGSYNWTYNAQKNEENIVVVNLFNDSEEDLKFLRAFNVKFKYFCDKLSKQIIEAKDLNIFKEADKNVFLMLAKIDEGEIQLREELENAVRKSFDESRRIGIDVSSYLLDRMKLDGGGVEFIKRILHDEISSGEMKSGFRKLEEKIPHRVDLSLEYLVTRDNFRVLFSEKEFEFCKKLMDKYGL